MGRSLMPGKCGHGYEPGDAPDIEVHGARERAVDEHERRCRGARVFWHPGVLFRVICCATCGRKVC